jgi:hypothetical protein
VRTLTRLTLLCLLAAAFPAVAAAQSDAPGDSYLNAIRLNPGTPGKPQPLPAAGATLSVDTSSYGVQADIYNPPRTGGIQEPNRCPPTPYGKTAWAWFFTSRWVRADVRASGAFDSVLAVMPFTSPSRPTLFPRSGACVNRSSTTAEDFGDDQPILAPGWYALQVGGVYVSGQPAGGQVGVTVSLREPPRLTVQVRASARARAGGAAVSVKVNAPHGARLTFTCARGSCKLPGRRTVRRTGTRKYLDGAFVPNGARLELRVTRAGYIGDYFAWKVRKGRLGRVSTRCTEPASTRPRTRCDG